MSGDIKRLLIEAVKPRDTSAVDLTRALCNVNGVEECELAVTDVDARTETVRLTIKGPNIDFAGLKNAMDESSISVKGIDEVSVAKAKKIKL